MIDLRQGEVIATAGLYCLAATVWHKRMTALRKIGSLPVLVTVGATAGILKDKKKYVRNMKEIKISLQCSLRIIKLQGAKYTVGGEVMKFQIFLISTAY